MRTDAEIRRRIADLEAEIARLQDRMDRLWRVDEIMRRARFGEPQLPPREPRRDHPHLRPVTTA